MNKGDFLRCVGFLVAGLVAAAAAGCDEGSSGSGKGGDGTGGSDGGSGASDTTSSSNGGTGGSSSTSSGGSSAKLSMIDDMEDGDGSILAADGRKGAWYTYNDETAAATQDPAVGLPFEMTPINPPRGQSAFAANTKGSGFMTWGSGFGFDLSNDGTAKAAYDASKYSGISFWARIGAGATGSVRLNIGDKNTTPEGGVCDPAACSDDFGKDIVLTADWQKFDIKFAEMTQVGWSMVLLPEIQKSALFAVHFQTGVDKTFDIWVDDIAFFE